MSAINNLDGRPVSDGKIIYSEELPNSLKFVIICMYEPFYNGKNSSHFRDSSTMYIHSLISNGNTHQYSNGINSIQDTVTYEVIKKTDKFTPVKPEFKTKDGFRVWQVEYQFHEYEKKEKNEKDEDIIVEYKSRSLKWLVEVPKKELIKFLVK